jgi:hypothetical protein
MAAIDLSDSSGIKRKFDQLYSSRIEDWQQRQGGHDDVLQRLNQVYERFDLMENRASNVTAVPVATQASPKPLGPRWTEGQTVDPDYVFSDEEDELAQDDTGFRAGDKAQESGNTAVVVSSDSMSLNANPQSKTILGQEGVFPTASQARLDWSTLSDTIAARLQEINDRPTPVLPPTEPQPESPIQPRHTSHSSEDYAMDADADPPDDGPITLSSFSLVQWPETRTIVCTACNPPCVLWAHNLLPHRKKFHARTSNDALLPLLVEKIPDLAQLSKDVIHPLPGRPAVSFLSPPVSGVKCPYCDVSFQAKKKMRGHLAEHHPGKEVGTAGVATMVQFMGRALNRYIAVTVPDGEEVERVVRQSVEGNDAVSGKDIA